MGKKNDPLIQMEKSECVHPLQIFVVYLIHPFEFKVFKQSSLTCHDTFLLHYEH